MGFQHMTKAARRRIQSKGGKANKKRVAEARRRSFVKETVSVPAWGSATTAGTFGSVKRITIEGNGPERPGEDLLKVVVTRIQQAERERIKSAILKILA